MRPAQQEHWHGIVPDQARLHRARLDEVHLARHLALAQHRVAAQVHLARQPTASKVQICLYSLHDQQCRKPTGLKCIRQALLSISS